MPLSGADAGEIGGYTLLDRLGAGGMGVVYLARSASGRRMAVKLVHAQLAEDDEFRVRFRQEIEAARRVSGAFTAPVVDADPDAEQPWMATLYVPGPTLAQRLAEGGPLRGTDLKVLALGLIEALRDIHQAGVVHRDLKPANVLMAEDGPRVIDFGISRAADKQTMTATGRVFGTPPFMSPEQLHSPRDVTPASDVFSLGALLVHAATGRGPFDADSPYMTAYRVVHEPPVLDGVPEPLLPIVARCLDKDPAKRPGSAELLLLCGELPGDLDEDRFDTVRMRTAYVAPATRTAYEPPAPAPATATAPAPAPTPAPARRFAGRRALVISLTAALVVAGVAVGAAIWPRGAHGDDGDSGAVAKPMASGSAHLPAPALPAGWQPWQTTLRVKRSLTTEGLGRDGGCLAEGEALYCGGEGFTVSRVDSATGKVDWRAASDVDSSAPLLVSDRTVVVNDLQGPAWSSGDRQWVTGLRTDNGTTRWTHSVAKGTTPVVSGKLVLTESEDERNLIAMNAADGNEAWRWPLPADGACGPWGTGGGLFVLCQGTLRSLDPTDGTAHELGAVPVHSEPVGMDGDTLVLLKYPVDATGASLPYATLVRVDTVTGAVRSTPLPKGTTAAREDPVSVIGGTLYLVNANGTVTAVTVSSGKLRWRRTTAVENLSAPVLSKKYGALYFVNGHGRALALRDDGTAQLWQSGPRDGGGAGAGTGASSGSSAQVRTVHDAIVALVDGLAFSVSPTAPDTHPAPDAHASTPAS